MTYCSLAWLPNTALAPQHKTMSKGDECTYPDWEGGYYRAEHVWDNSEIGCCRVCGKTKREAYPFDPNKREAMMNENDGGDPSKLSRKEASEIYDSEWWEDASYQEIVAFQLFEPRLCMPFDLFHEAAGKVLRRPVYTHEFAFVEQLREEYLTNRPPMTLGESLSRLQTEFPHVEIVPVIISPNQRIRQ